MKKSLFLVITLVCAILASSSCSKTETYADMLKKERRAISRCLEERNIDVLNTFPADSLFAENEFFRDENTGVYFRVIDWGTGPKVSKGDNVFLRYGDENTFLITDSTYTGNIGHDYWIKITYGDESTYKKSSASQKGDEFAMFFLSAGSILPLKYGVGHGGKVSLIIPFSSGSYMQQYQYEPIYIGELRYRFE